MMFHMIKWFTGITLIQLKENFVHTTVPEATDKAKPSPIPTCPVIKINDSVLYAACVNLEIPLTSVPRTLDPSIQIMNLTSNPIMRLESDDLQAYTDLRELIISNLSFLQYFSPNFLDPVQKLVIFNMSDTPLGHPTVNLPSSLHEFYADNVNSVLAGVLDIDMSKLSELKYLSLILGSIQAFPVLHPKAPLVYICLFGNPTTHLDYFHIAPYCRLEVFDIIVYVPGKQYAEKCCSVRAWMDEYEIISDLKCDMECGKIEFDFKAIEMHNECLSVDESWNFDGIMEIIVAFALISSFAYLVFKYYRSTAVKAHRKDIKSKSKIRSSAEIEWEEEEEDGKVS